MKKKSNIEREDTSKKVGSLPYIWKNISKNKGAMIGLAAICLIVIMSLLTPVLFEYDEQGVNLVMKNAVPSAEYWFGCDYLGRDIFTRVFYGARYTLMVGVFSVAISTCFGVILGCIAGYFGGIVDSIIMRCLDIFQAFPSLLLAIALAAAFGPGFWKCILAVGIAGVPGTARMMRANILSVRDSEFIEAATAINCSTFRIVAKHVFPNSVSPLIVSIAMTIAGAGLQAASLSFLGLGIQEPQPEWGAMISHARNYISAAPHTVIIPGIFIMITVLSFNLIGDAIRDALDPKLKD